MKRICSILLIWLASLLLIGCSEDEPFEAIKMDDSALLSQQNILNIAHRGASGHSPEHTITAYEKGEEMQADYIEIDLQLTKDGQLIAMHDDTVARTTNGKGEVQQLTLDEIIDLDAGSWFNEAYPALAESEYEKETVPTLEEILTNFGKDTNYYIETKIPEEYPHMVEKLVKTLEKHGLIDDELPEGKVIIQSFSEQSLQEVSTLAPSLPLIQLLNKEALEQINDEKVAEISSYAIGVGVNYQELTDAQIDMFQTNDLLIHAYTVNEEKDMRELIERGVTGMFTDYPDRLTKVLAEVKAK